MPPSLPPSPKAFVRFLPSPAPPPSALAIQIKSVLAGEIRSNLAGKRHDAPAPPARPVARRRRHGRSGRGAPADQVRALLPRQAGGGVHAAHALRLLPRRPQGPRRRHALRPRQARPARGQGPGEGDCALLGRDQRRRPRGQRAQGHGHRHEAAEPRRGGHRGHQVAAQPLLRPGAGVARQHPPRPLQEVRAAGRPDLAAQAQAAAHPPGPRLQRQAHQDGPLPGPQVPGHPRAGGHQAPRQPGVGADAEGELHGGRGGVPAGAGHRPGQQQDVQPGDLPHEAGPGAGGQGRAQAGAPRRRRRPPRRRLPPQGLRARAGDAPRPRGQARRPPRLGRRHRQPRRQEVALRRAHARLLLQHLAAAAVHRPPAAPAGPAAARPLRRREQRRPQRRRRRSRRGQEDGRAAAAAAAAAAGQPQHRRAALLLAPHAAAGRQATAERAAPAAAEAPVAGASRSHGQPEEDAVRHRHGQGSCRRGSRGEDQGGAERQQGGRQEPGRQQQQRQEEVAHRRGKVAGAPGPQRVRRGPRRVGPGPSPRRRRELQRRQAVSKGGSCGELLRHQPSGGEGEGGEEAEDLPGHHADAQRALTDRRRGLVLVFFSAAGWLLTQPKRRRWRRCEGDELVLLGVSASRF